MKAGPEVWISHLKPGAEARIMAELRDGLGAKAAVQALTEGQIVTI